MKIYLTLFFCAIAGFISNAQSIKLVKDLNPGSGSSNLQIRQSVGEKIIFSDFGTSGQDIYVTDGSEVGTVKLLTLTSGQYFEKIFSIGSSIILVSSDGNNVNFHDIDLASNVATKKFTSTLFSGIREIVYSAGSYYCTADGVLYKIDQNTGANTIVKNIGLTYGLAAYQNSLYMIGGSLNSLGLYKSDGTAAGTVLVKNITGTVTTGSKFAKFFDIGNKLLFSFENASTPSIVGLYSTDGTEAGTELLINVDWTSNEDYEYKILDIVHDGKVYFAANPIGVQGEGNFFYVSDGTVAGSKRLDLDFTSGISPRYLTVYGGKVYCYSSRYRKIYNTTLNSIEESYDYSSITSKYGFGSELGNYLTVFNNKLFSANFTPDNGNELWECGKDKRDFKHYDFIAGSTGNKPEQLTPAGLKYLYFVGNTAANGSELYVFEPSGINGTQARKIEEIKVFPNPSANIIEFSESIHHGILVITDIHGKQILRQTIQGNTIDVTRLKPGFYTLSLIQDDTVYLSRFIRI